MIHKNVYRLQDLRQIYDRPWRHCVTCKDAFATRNVTPGHTHQLARNTANTHHRHRLLDGCLAQATVFGGYQDETAVMQCVHCYIYRIVYYSLSLDCRITTIILYQLNVCNKTISNLHILYLLWMVVNGLLTDYYLRWSLLVAILLDPSWLSGVPLCSYSAFCRRECYCCCMLPLLQFAQ